MSMRALSLAIIPLALFVSTACGDKDGEILVELTNLDDEPVYLVAGDDEFDDSTLLDPGETRQEVIDPEDSSTVTFYAQQDGVVAASVGCYLSEDDPVAAAVSYVDEQLFCNGFSSGDDDDDNGGTSFWVGSWRLLSIDGQVPDQLGMGIDMDMTQTTMRQDITSYVDASYSCVYEATLEQLGGNTFRTTATATDCVYSEIGETTEVSIELMGDGTLQFVGGSTFVYGRR